MARNRASSMRRLKYSCRAFTAGSRGSGAGSTFSTDFVSPFNATGSGLFLSSVAAATPFVFLSSLSLAPLTNAVRSSVFVSLLLTALVFCSRGVVERSSLFRDGDEDLVLPPPPVLLLLSSSSFPFDEEVRKAVSPLLLRAAFCFCNRSNILSNSAFRNPRTSLDSMPCSCSASRNSATFIFSGLVVGGAVVCRLLLVVLEDDASITMCIGDAEDDSYRLST
mmetsp:Transcript_20710/g.39379  ORF Transcript_20710/g.39379 Transcript_20710/m.39379 type:complete len:222 (-) Transcript_20710:365-1030(-)